MFELVVAGAGTARAGCSWEGALIEVALGDERAVLDDGVGSITYDGRFAVTADSGALALAFDAQRVALYPREPIPTTTDGVGWLGAVDATAAGPGRVAIVARRDRLGAGMELRVTELDCPALSLEVPTPPGGPAIGHDTSTATSFAREAGGPPAVAVGPSLVEVLERRGEWARVRTTGARFATGWVPASALTGGVVGGIAGGSGATPTAPTRCAADVPVTFEGQPIGVIRAGRPVVVEPRGALDVVVTSSFTSRTPLIVSAEALAAGQCGFAPTPEPPPVAAAVATLATTLGIPATAEVVRVSGTTARYDHPDRAAVVGVGQGTAAAEWAARVVPGAVLVDPWLGDERPIRGTDWSVRCSAIRGGGDVCVIDARQDYVVVRDARLARERLPLRELAAIAAEVDANGHW